MHDHEPVQEDCGNCHDPHGTVADSLLEMRQPFPCHSCHTPQGGQVLPVTGQGNNPNATNPPAQFMLR